MLIGYVLLFREEWITGMDTLVSSNSACELNDKIKVLKQLDSNIPQTVINQHGGLFMQSAIQKADLKCVQILLESGVEPCQSPKDKTAVFCPIQYVAIGNHKEILACLLKHGGNPDCRHGDDAYSSPLMDAVRRSSWDPTVLDMVKMFVYSGASLRTNPSKLYLDILRNKNCIELLQFFIGVGPPFPKDLEHMAAYLNASKDKMSEECARDVLHLLYCAGSRTLKGSNGISHWANSFQRITLSQNLTLQESCRSVIQQIFIDKSNGYFILPDIRKLPLPASVKEFISFGTHTDYLNFESA